MGNSMMNGEASLESSLYVIFVTWIKPASRLNISRLIGFESKKYNNTNIFDLWFKTPEPNKEEKICIYIDFALEMLFTWFIMYVISFGRYLFIKMCIKYASYQARKQRLSMNSEDCYQQMTTYEKNQTDHHRQQLLEFRVFTSNDDNSNITTQ